MKKLTTFVDISLDSKDYVLPINMNMDIALRNIHVTNLYSVAMMAGSTLEIDENSELILDNMGLDGTIKGELIVYDKDQHGKFYYNPGSESYTIYQVHYTPTKTYTRTIDTDASINVNGKITVNSDGALYTTESGANITSSKGNGKVEFKSVANPSNTYQYDHLEVGLITIPITNAKLHNAPPYSDTKKEYVETMATTYTYSKDEGKWLSGSDAGLTKYTVPAFNITLPTTNPQPLPGEIICYFNKPTDLVFEDDDFNVNKESGVNFVIKDKVWDDATAQLRIPIEYTQTNEHGEYIAVVKLTDNHDALNLNVNIEVIAYEDYRPVFSVNSPASIEPSLCDPQPVAMSIIPQDNNVTTLLGDEKMIWRASIIYPTETPEEEKYFNFDFGESDAYLSGSRISYDPKGSWDTKTATLTLTAISKYVAGADELDLDDAEDFAKLVEEGLIVTNEVPLVGKATLCENPLAFADISTLSVGTTDIMLFANMGNHENSPTVIEYDENYITLTGDGSEGNPYKIAAIQEGQTEITATQEAQGVYKRKSISIDVNIVPNLQWNWQRLYYGATHTNPITTSDEGWELSLAEDDADICNELLNLRKQDGEYILEVSEPAGINTPCEAKFIYSYQGDNIELTSTISGLRHLSVCVDSEDKYIAVTFENEKSKYTINGVEFNSTSTENSSWTMQFIGTPSQLSFTPNGSNQWYIEQGTSNNNYTTLVNWTEYRSGSPVTLLLDPNTRFIRFTYGSSTSGDNVGLLSGICVEKFNIVASSNLVYIPVGHSKDVVLKHSRGAKLQDLDIKGSVDEAVDEGLFGEISNYSEQDGYYESILTLTAVSKGEYYVVVKEDNNPVTIRVVAYDYPMDLPVIINNWTDKNDQDEYFYFYTDSEKSSKVHWDKDNTCIVLENTGSANIERSVVFAFKGAPSIIKFNYDKNIISDEWIISESANNSDWKVSQGARKYNGV